MMLTRKQRHASVVVNNNTVYAIGGFPYAETAARLDIRTKQWEEVASLSAASGLRVSTVTATVIDDEVYAFDTDDENTLVQKYDAR